MSGQESEAGAAKALSMGNEIVKKLEAKYNIEDIEVKDLKNGKVQVFAVSDDFTKMSTPSLNENFPGPGEIVDAKYLNNAMIDYFHRMNIKLLINTKTEKGIKGRVGTFYGDLVFNGGGDDIKLKDIVSVEIIESSISEAKEEDKKFLIQQAKDKYNKLQQAFLKIENPSDSLVKQLEKAEQKYKDLIKSTISEAKEEDKVDTITMDVPLFIRMLEYSREDAAEDMDLHDVTEKAISLGKERGILQMDDYDEIIGTTKEIKEVNLKQAKLSSAEYQKAKKLKDFKASDWKWNASEDLYTKVVKEDLTQKISEAFDKINEELCPAGKAYRKRRMAAGEKSSAYLSGRAVKVCKGQMSGKKKKK
jgi:hypothetical protein